MQAISTALGGLHQAEDLLNQTASRLAESPLGTGAGADQVSLSDDAVSLLEVKTSYQANLDSIKVADEMEKSTLSLLA
jgi:hypothetical protein